MSEYNRRRWNNDGMDPDWKPPTNEQAAPPSPDPYKALEIAREALSELLRLKELKRVRGPTEEYLRCKPMAWDNASEALRKIDEAISKRQLSSSNDGHEDYEDDMK